MKKIAIAVLLALIVSGAFAQGFQMSVGGGAFLDWSFNNGVKGTYNGDDYYFGIRNLSFGSYGFFDAAYVEVGVGIAYGWLTGIREVPGDSGSISGASTVQLDLTLVGKYPFQFGSIILFPLLGISYNMALSVKDVDGSSVLNASDLNQIGLLGGVGLDFGITDSLYLRGEAMFHLRFPSKAMRDATGEYAFDTTTTLGLGPRIRVAVGYKF